MSKRAAQDLPAMKSTGRRASSASDRSRHRGHDHRSCSAQDHVSQLRQTHRRFPGTMMSGGAPELTSAARRQVRDRPCAMPQGSYRAGHHHHALASGAARDLCAKVLVAVERGCPSPYAGAVLPARYSTSLSIEASRQSSRSKPARSRRRQPTWQPRSRSAATVRGRRSRRWRQLSRRRPNARACWCQWT